MIPGDALKDSELRTYPSGLRRMLALPPITPATRFSLAERAPGQPDTVGHSSVQPWSAGPLFPAVIVYVEHYPEGMTAENSEPSVSHKLILGAFVEEYATYEDAEAVARYVCRDGRIIPERYAEVCT